MKKNLARTIAILGALLAAPAVASADTYTMVSFNGAIAGGNANVKAPFSGNGFTQSDPLSGSFVFDNQLVPGAGSGVQTVFFSSFPNAIPAATAFNLTLDGLHVDLSNNLNSQTQAGIIYNNGHFAGFNFLSDFVFLGNPYQFQIAGGIISVLPVDANGNPTSFSSLINAHINIGDANLTNATSFSTSPVPGPIVGAGLPGLMMAFGGFVAWRRRNSVAA